MPKGKWDYFSSWELSFRDQGNRRLVIWAGKKNSQLSIIGSSSLASHVKRAIELYTYTSAILDSFVLSDIFPSQSRANARTPIKLPINPQNTRKPLYRLKILLGVLSEFEKSPQEDERNFNQLIRSFGKLLTFTSMQWSLQPQFSIKKLS